MTMCTGESLVRILPYVTAKKLLEYRKSENKSVVDFFERTHPEIAAKVGSGAELTDREDRMAKLLLVPEMFDSGSYSRIRCMSDSLLDAVYTYYVDGYVPRFKETYADWKDTVLRFNDIHTLTSRELEKITSGRCHTLKDYVYEK